MRDYNGVDWLLGGDMKVEDTKITMMDSLTKFIGRFEASRLNESDMSDFITLGLYEEMSELEDILGRIHSKICTVDEELNESEILAMGISGIIGSVVGAIGLSNQLRKAWAEDNLVPKFLQGSSHKIDKILGKFTGAEREKVRAQILKEFERQGKLEGLSSTEISAMINAEIAREKIIAKKKASINYERYSNNKADEKSKPKSTDNSRTEVGDAFKKLNMTDKEKQEYFQKRFPNKVKPKG
jgi:hypothetical protein